MGRPQARLTGLCAEPNRTEYGHSKMASNLSSDTALVAKAFIDALESSRFVDAFNLLASDGQYIVIGTTPLSGVYRGRQAVLDQLVPALATFKVPPKLQFGDVIVSGDRAVLLASGSGEGPKGPYRQPYYAFVTKVKNREFSEIVEMMDTQMLNSALFG